MNGSALKRIFFPIIFQQKPHPIGIVFAWLLIVIALSDAAFEFQFFARAVVLDGKVRAIDANNGECPVAKGKCVCTTYLAHLLVEVDGKLAYQTLPAGWTCGINKPLTNASYFIGQHVNLRYVPGSDRLVIQSLWGQLSLARWLLILAFILIVISYREGADSSRDTN